MYLLGHKYFHIEIIGPFLEGCFATHMKSIRKIHDINLVIFIL